MICTSCLVDKEIGAFPMKVNRSRKQVCRTCLESNYKINRAKNSESELVEDNRVFARILLDFVDAYEEKDKNKLKNCVVRAIQETKKYKGCVNSEL